MFRFITFCLVLHVAVAKLNFLRAVQKLEAREGKALTRVDRSLDALTEDARIMTTLATIPMDCTVFTGRVGFVVTYKDKGETYDINDCVEGCNDNDDCEYWSFYNAKWLKRRRCYHYQLDAARLEDSDIWTSGTWTDCGSWKKERKTRADCRCFKIRNSIRV